VGGREGSAAGSVADDLIPVFWLVEGDPLHRVLRRAGLIPARGLGIARRIVVLALVCWLPIVALAFLGMTEGAGEVTEPRLGHFGVHVRCLVAIPLFILAEGGAYRLTLVLRQFLNAGLVDAVQEPRFRAILRETERLKNSWLAFAVILLLTIVNSVVSGVGAPSIDEVSWAAVGGKTHEGLVAAGWWYVVVAKPVFVFLLLTWLWRWLVVGILFRRIARLELRLAPTHADCAGGLGFLDLAAQVLLPVVFAASAVIAAHFGHGALYHGSKVSSWYGAMAALTGVSLILTVAPLLAFCGTLFRLKQRARLEYGSLVARHGWLLQRRWIHGEALEEDALLNAAELGPLIDVASMHGIVRSIRLVPFSREMVIGVVAAALLPMVPVITLEIPLKEMLAKLASMLL
jgi:hypothetical protein